MSVDPFTSVFEAFAVLAPRVCTDAEDEREILPSILNEVRRFCAEHVDSERIDREGKLGSDLLSEVAQRGWFGLTTPGEYGGAGLSLAAAARVVSELAAHNGSLGTCVGLHSGLALRALLQAAPAELQQRYLPDVAEGRRIASFAATEPSAGSDISAVRTTLALRDGQLRLSGSKCYVTNGGICGLLTVLARSPGLGGARAGHTLLLIDPKWHGVSRGPEERKMGLKGSSTVTITFEDVEIPEDHILGEVSQGLVHAHAALCWGRTFMAAGCLGSARSAFGVAEEHTQTRQQFGRPLSAFPLVRAALANAQAEIYAIESALRLVCALSDTNVGDLAACSSMLKVLASDGAWQIADTSLQLMGGAGYMEDNGIARRLRDLRVTRIFEGANDVLRISLASSALTWSMEQAPALPQGGMLPRFMAKEVEQFNQACFATFTAIQHLKKKWGFRLYEQQPRAAALSDGLIGLFAALAIFMRCTENESGSVEPLARLSFARQLACVTSSIEQATSADDRELALLVEQVSAKVT